MAIVCTERKGSKYGVFSGPYFPKFGLNTGKYGPEKTPYLDTFHAVMRFKQKKHPSYSIICNKQQNVVNLRTFLNFSKVLLLVNFWLYLQPFKLS